ncbi:MAG TPA: capsule assembly Wzi family protein [Acidobacteriaceae bacterium]|nr:capsule assembly Wzi family protein [Acidobacteriaceae bacterium]
MVRLVAPLLVLAGTTAVGVRAQAPASGIWSRLGAGALLAPQLAGLPGIGGTAEDLWRLAQLRGGSTAGFLLRTPSSMMLPLADSGSPPGGLLGRWALLLPSVQYTDNSAVPFSMNDGAMWAGKGANLGVAAGIRWESGPVQLVLSPQVHYEANRPLPFFDNLHSGLPYPLPPYRSEYSTLWNIWPHGMDIPFRFGDERRLYGDPGESSASIRLGPIRTGFSTEHEWWGPGIQNALLLSNNAAGVPRLFVRSARPLHTAAGDLEFSTFLGRLHESPFFRTAAAQTTPDALVHVGTETRLLSAAALVWRPRWDPHVSLGVARSVYAPRIYRGPILMRWFDVFANTGQPDDRPASDSTARLGRDQLVSIFGRWVLPDDGFEVYFEWLRATMPVSLRDFLVDPSHSRGYTVGLQWLGPPNSRGGAVRLQGEATNLEQDPSFRYRPIGSIYTSRVVPQGYTQRGQSLGAAIGPGSSSQWLAADYVATSWSLGVFAQRIRWNEDAHAQTPYPDFKGWCENDVTLLSGVRARWENRLSAVSASLSSGRRYNVFFQSFAACPLVPTDPGRVVNLQNVTLRLSLEPLVRRLR